MKRAFSRLYFLHIHIKLSRYINIKIFAMKTVYNKLSGAWIMVFLMLFASTQCTESAGADEDAVPGDEIFAFANPDNELTDEEMEGIRFMREEEKLARDVYLYLYEIFPLRPFGNIALSEQSHMDAIGYLINTYHMEDPVGDRPQGEFHNESLQELYNELIEKGSTSPEEALKVGALIEEVDILDLRHELDSVATNENLIRVYTNLCSASENHLRAFVRVLSRYGVEYTPVKLSQEEYNRILTD
jgi:hypothetical protein